MQVHGGAAVAAVLIWLSAATMAAQKLELAPGTQYDPAVPTLRQVLGYDHGDRITTPADVGVYLEALAKAAPDRVRVAEYARTWEGRPLWLATVGSAERLAQLDRIRADRRRLGDPRSLAPGDLDALIRDAPAVVALMHSVHGNEISGVDAALAEAYYLVAARGDATVDLILREAIVLIDPMQNPDGRARFLAQNGLGRAMEPDPDPLSAEHDEPWPGGRSNHYLFDLNRDWFAQNHPETIGRVKYHLEWLPQVSADLHEMGGESTYYFPPPAPPPTGHITKQQMSWLETLGRANAARFDERGFAYFIREVFDAFYPGYGASWPFFYGGVGQTFEMASARGLRYRREDGGELTFRDGVVRHFTAAVATAATAARNRERLLRDFVEFRRSAVTEGGGREYLLVPGADPSRAAQLAALLGRNGIDVRRADEPLRAGDRTLPAGTFIVPLGQPMARLVRSLLDPDTPMEAGFVAEQDRRRKQRLPDQIYDITSWSLPLLYDVELVTVDRPTGVRSSPHVEGTTSASVSLPPARVGYLLPWGTAAAAAVAEALREGLQVRSTGGAFTLAGRRYAVGTAIVRTADHGADLPQRLGGIASRHGADVVPIDTGWVDEGLSLGSGRTAALRAPRVLLAWDAPTQSLSAGWARFVLERRFGQPVSAIRVSTLPRADLARYDVIVLPSGSYGAAINDEMLRRLREWMRTGGTLVTLGEASRWAAGDRVNLLDTRTELRDGRPDVTPPPPPAAQTPGAPKEPFDYDRAITPDRERPEHNTGVVLRVVLDPEHWLSAGSDGEIQAMVEGDRIFTPLKLDKGANVGVYAAADRLVASGLVWEEARGPLARKAYLMHQPVGQGHLIAFAEEPNFRGFTAATELLFVNAVLFGPAR